MNVAVIGKGGREHAIVKALSLSESVKNILALPGSKGMIEAESIPVDTSNVTQVIELCRKGNIDLVVIGPEKELAEGLGDQLRDAGFAVFGPNGFPSQLESSKIYSKEFMNRYNVPTAHYEIVTSLENLKNVVEQFTPPYVLKADGLAGGKGVFICKDLVELMAAGEKLWGQKILGSAGTRAILEQFKAGYEISFFVLTDGESFQPLPLAQDHKRLLDGDLGPNTGGMGTVAPVHLPEETYKTIIDTVVKPTIAGFTKEGFVYRGVVFIGLMMTDSGPSVLEYNIRFGDPETQVLLPLLNGDWGKTFMEVAQGNVPELQWHSNKAAACVVLAAENYPEATAGGVEIHGLSEPLDNNSYILHAGTDIENDSWVTQGGRVLNVVGLGDEIVSAVTESYGRIKKMNWSGMQFRKDIGKQFTN